MSQFDLLAHTSRLKNVSPACKAGLALFLIVLCLCVERTAFSIFAALCAGVVCVLWSGVPLIKWLRFCTIPFSFLLLGCIMIAITVTPEASGVVSAPMFGSFLTITHAGILEATNVFCRAMACISWLYFLCVTTPMTHLLGLMERIHAPSLLVELMLMIYRFLFLLAELASRMTTAQHARLGNITYRASMRSFAAMASTLFVRAMQKSVRIYDAMESRGYTGGLTYTGILPKSTMGQRTATVVFALIAVACAVTARLLVR